MPPRWSQPVRSLPVGPLMPAPPLLSCACLLQRMTSLGIATWRHLAPAAGGQAQRQQQQQQRAAATMRRSPQQQQQGGAAGGRASQPPRRHLQRQRRRPRAVELRPSGGAAGWRLSMRRSGRTRGSAAAGRAAGSAAVAVLCHSQHPLPSHAPWAACHCMHRHTLFPALHCSHALCKTAQCLSLYTAKVDIAAVGSKRGGSSNEAPEQQRQAAGGLAV